MLDVTERVAVTASPTVVSRKSVLIRLAIHVAWVIALAVAVVARVARFGFTAADQGFILAGSWRLLHGEIPHLDIVSARPLGSSVLHVIDFLIPAPLYISSVFLAMIELIVFTIACAALLTRTSPLQWGPLRTLLVAAASLVNLHLFTLMAWHTIDGLMLTAVGWWMLDAGLRSQNPWQRRIGLALLGFAVITKQSFALAVPIGFLILFLHPDARKQAKSWLRVLIDLLCLGSVPILYFGTVAAAGGLGEAILQLTSAKGAYGESLIWFWQNDFSVIFDQAQIDWRRAVLGVFGVSLLLGVLWLLRDRIGVAGVWLRILAAAGGVAITVYSLADTELSYPPTWAIKIAWIFAAAIVLDAVVHKYFPWRPLLLVVLAYSASLSWGYDYPALLGGTLVIATLEILLSAVPEVRIVPRVVTALAGVVALAAASFALVTAHDRSVTADQPHDKLTVDLGSVLPEMSGIRTSPITATYVRQIKDCVAKYPADNVAVLPHNSFVYPVMKLHNPFPLDWPLDAELVADAIPRTDAAIDNLNRDGHYLVIFQTLEIDALRKGVPVPASVPLDAEIAPTSSVAVRLIKDRLTGERITCGSFVGVWSR
ncbi:hypothetical protein JOF56_002032 [Kibdelosporangium banguiense]|uniref:DUF2029 domain-containing protein n=1 Tax=Kibdelosporangium banguiense TaxID=1365924 RepID=A0ABS4TB52_9PSEU|nr:hypothetical protein [Kibdelosporangium banguiense]MBP2321647.1 hypothetical protein [Kibdelosporangium banguiense]